MTSGSPELLVSLTIQCTLLLLVAHRVVNHSGKRQSRDRIWPCCHLLILALTLAAFFFPHVRLLRGELLLDACHRATTLPVLQYVWSALLWIWCLGAAGLALNMFMSLFQMSLMLRSTTEMSSANEACAVDGNRNMLRVSDSLASELKSAGVRVLQSETCSAPFCWQLQCPIIVLPNFIESFPQDEVEAVVRHELAHLRAQHPMELFLQRLVEMIYWFNPLVWKCSGDAVMQRELVADRKANFSQAHAVSFVKSLMRLSDAGFDHENEATIGLSLFTGGPSLLSHRIAQLTAIDWTQNAGCPPASAKKNFTSGTAYLTLTCAIASLVWIPLNPHVTGRTFFSPWPPATATLLHEAGLDVRDYELDSHRVMELLDENH